MAAIVLQCVKKAIDAGDQAGVADAQLGGKHYKTYDEVASARSDITNLSPKISFQFWQNPMAEKGMVFSTKMQIVQIVGKKEIIFGRQFTEFMPFVAIYGFISTDFDGADDLIDGQWVQVIAEITGTYQYETADSSFKTVPKMIVYAIQPALQ